MPGVFYVQPDYLLGKRLTNATQYDSSKFASLTYWGAVMNRVERADFHLLQRQLLHATVPSVWLALFVPKVNTLLQPVVQHGR